MLNFVITEILENIFNHASSSIGGLICCQTYPKKKLVRIGITDLGIGIERSLRANPAVELSYRLLRCVAHRAIAAPGTRTP